MIKFSESITSYWSRSFDDKGIILRVVVQITKMPEMAWIHLRRPERPWVRLKSCHVVMRQRPLYFQHAAPTRWTAKKATESARGLLQLTWEPHPSCSKIINIKVIREVSFKAVLLQVMKRETVATANYEGQVLTAFVGDDSCTWFPCSLFLIILVKRVVLVAFDQVAIERLESLTPGKVLFVYQLRSWQP
jgi:hypothetical protein